MQFDPSAGTLNAVTFQYTGHGGGTPYLNLSNNGSTTETLSYRLYDPTFQTILASGIDVNEPAHSGSGVGLSFTTSDPLLSQYVGVGSINLQASFSKGNLADTMSIITDCYSCADRTAIALITYDFTPLPTPLPATLPLFATGLAGLGWVSRRRRKQAA